MDISKASAVVLALLAAVLVIVAGKSCTDDIESTNRQSKQKNRVSTVASTAPYSFSLGEKGTQPTETETEAPTLPYDVITNMIGDIVETVPKPTNENGEIETTEVTGTKSILEQYEEQHQTTEPTQPELEIETTKYIEPAKDIVINIG